MESFTHIVRAHVGCGLERKMYLSRIKVLHLEHVRIPVYRGEVNII